MTPTASVKVVVRWNTRDEGLIARLRALFGLPDYNTLNGWTPGEIPPEKWPEFERCLRSGHFSHIRTEWKYDGRAYSWKCK